MIGYITLGSNNIARISKFYDEIFSELGFSRIYDYESIVAWGENEDSQFFAITTPFNREPATVGNGAMIALKLESTEQVTKLHQKALGLGASNEGDQG
ncbi:VOC family protein [Porticoccaceae bacterium]|nr:VOC family protein [Porticoccaceae bacterium]